MYHGVIDDDYLRICKESVAAYLKGLKARSYSNIGSCPDEFRCKYIYTHRVWGVPGGKVNILGGNSIGHFKKKKVCTYMCPIPNGFRDRAISLYSSKIVDKKEILRTVSNAGIYCSSDKVGTIYLV
jgi:hypothetical protein